MARPHVVTTLEAKYARLLGFQLRLVRPSLSIAADLDHIEAVTRLFHSDWHKGAVKPIAPRFASRWPKKGVGIRAAISVAECPFSATEIAHATYLRLGCAAPSTREIAIVGTNLIYSLRRHFGDRLAMIGVGLSGTG